MSYRTLLLSVLCFSTSMVKAQDTLKTHITYDLTTEAAVGTGDYTAYQLATNRHHVLGTRSNTAYMRGAVNVEHQLNKDWKLSGAVDAIASVHADHKAYLQQCYANLSYQQFFLEVGAKEQPMVVRDEDLSIGSFAKGINAKPLAQIHIGTNGFWTVPYTKGILEINFDGGYGKFLDSDYREKAYYRGVGADGQNVNDKYATGILYHQKHLYFRINFSEQFFFIGGIEHVVQFGGTKYGYDKNDVFTSKSKPTNLKAFMDVILPLGDKNYYENDAMEDWIFGNHLGEMTVQLGWNINKDHTLQAYYDDLFDDGSGMRKSNGWDGTYGLQYNNKAAGRQYVRKAVVEYFQSTNQSGPLHYDGGDYPEHMRREITDKVTGNDEYYNHNCYDSYTHYGMTPGIALITSPIYNKGGETRFLDNRVKAWHLGVSGEITNHISYLAKGSYREGWGTYDFPLSNKHHSFDAMVQGTYSIGPWQFGAACAFDKGNIYGDCTTFDIKIGYHGKIL
jgi:hypothetical protein